MAKTQNIKIQNTKETLPFFYGIAGKDLYARYCREKNLSSDTAGYIDSIYLYYVCLINGAQKAGVEINPKVDTFEKFIDMIDDGHILEDDLTNAFNEFDAGGKAKK